MLSSLSRETKKALCEIYAEYLKRRSSGSPKSSARYFSNEDKTKENNHGDWTTSDFKDYLSELKRAGAVKMYVDGGFELQDSAIIYMEQRFQNGLSDVLDWLAKIKSVIPFA